MTNEATDIYGNPTIVKAAWDSEANVWVATSNDIPGLVTEAESREKLLDKLKVMIPELLAANERESK